MNLSKNTYKDIVAILPAAGIGKRMCSSIPKQYICVEGKTILEHSINLILLHPRIREIIISINPLDHWYCKLSISKNTRIKTVIGGKNRADSVMSALNKIRSAYWVLVHDAVRPCLRKEDLFNLLSITKYTDIGGVLAFPVCNTIKNSYFGTNFIKKTLKRKNLWNVLTPQLFTFKLLKSCLKRALSEGLEITDDSSVIERYGYIPILIPGHSDNIKVTFPEDLDMVRFFLKKRD